MKKPTSPPFPQTPRLYRLAFAASQSGMSTELFLKCCQRGEIPVPVHRLGERGLWHVDAEAWLKWRGAAAPATLANLFV